MAMKYGDPELEELYRTTLVTAVQRTGFKLSRLDANPPAGLIDVRLSVARRPSLALRRHPVFRSALQS